MNSKPLDFKKNQSLLERANELQLQAKNDARIVLLRKNANVTKQKNLLDRQNALRKISEKETQRYADILQKEKELKDLKSKENLSLLERSEGNDFTQLGKKINSKTKVEVVEPTDDYFNKVDKIYYYAVKYRLPFQQSGYKKTYKELAQDIKKYEVKYLKTLLDNGVDKKYDEYGLYITII
jgi:hypothetical protein